MEGSCVRSLCYQVERGYGGSLLTTDSTREKASQADLSSRLIGSQLIFGILPEDLKKEECSDKT